MSEIIKRVELTYRATDGTFTYILKKKKKKKKKKKMML